MNKLLKPKEKEEIRKNFEKAPLLKKFHLVSYLIRGLSDRINTSYIVSDTIGDNHKRKCTFLINQRIPSVSSVESLDTFGNITLSTNLTTDKTSLCKDSKEILQFDSFDYYAYEKISNFLENIKTFDEFMNI